ETMNTRPDDWHDHADQVLEPLPAPLAADVITSHQLLNRTRPIPVGEWWELLALQETHGAAQLLIWQARASRATTQRPNGITPSYYQVCANTAWAARPSSVTYRAIPPTSPAPLGGEQSKSLPLDPVCDALLMEMGVRERRLLAGVPYELIRHW